MKIDKKVPIPNFIKHGIHYKTISKMKVGDSVLIENTKEANRFIGCCVQTFREWKFTRRTLDNGTRIWRIK